MGVFKVFLCPYSLLFAPLLVLSPTTLLYLGKSRYFYKMFYTQ
jgi:hypothetical protein